MTNTISLVSVEEQAHPKRLNFSDPAQRDAHVQAFLSWLPSVLHTAPGIEWQLLPSRVMGYFVRTVANDPDRIPLAFAIGCATGAVKKRSLLDYCRMTNNLLRRLRTQYGLQDFTQLRSRDIWERFVAGRTPSRGELNMLAIYDALASYHLRAHFEKLDLRERVIWEPYVLPSLPAGFLDRQGTRKASEKASQQRRKEQSDVILPLFPLLVEIAQLRKQAAERFIKEFRRHRDRAIAGEISLPYHFQYTDHLFSVTEGATTLAEVQLHEREVTLSLTLWDRASWVKAHWEQYGVEVRRKVKRQIDAYAPEHNTLFLQYQGKSCDFLWYGDLLEKRFLTRRTKDFDVSRPGLLTPSLNESGWLSYASRVANDAMLFEPEVLYRGTLYAATLATLSLTNGSRLNELLQVSAKRFETVVIDELRNQQPTGRKIGILVQHLLPKGSRQEHERQFFLIGEMAGRLLTEIGQLLEKTHDGMIPVIQPHGNTKEEDLQPEPYFFQWAASDDGRLGLLTAGDVGTLLRFLFYGLTLTTRTGQPIKVAAHLLRHVLATHARTVKNVPAEAVAYLLHHRVTLSASTRTLSIPEATAYYSRLPVEQLLALLFEAQTTIATYRERSYLQVPSLHTLEEMDEALRKVFEQWGTIGPTVLGYCSAGLCVRPNNRALCLDCPYLVPHYSNLRNAKIWRKLYVFQAQIHDAHGHVVDAKQARQMIQYIDDIIRIMEIQIRARQDAGILPFAETLLSTQEDEGGEQ